MNAVEHVEGRWLHYAGAGLGVPSLAAGLYGAREVVMTDVAAGVHFLKGNIALKYAPTYGCFAQGRVERH